jgi:hypothetical protein
VLDETPFVKRSSFVFSRVGREVDKYRFKREEEKKS